MSEDPKSTHNFVNKLKDLGIKTIGEPFLDSLKGTVSKSLKTATAVGFGMLAIAAYGIYNHNKSDTVHVNTGLDFINNGFKPKALGEVDINVLHLNEMLEHHVWNEYHAIKNEKRVKRDEQPHLELDWSHVEYIPDKVCSKEKEHCNSDYLLYRAIIENCTLHEQKVSVNKKKSTGSFYKYSVTKGFKNNTDTNLSILPISEQVKFKLGLNNTFSLQSSTDNIVNKMQTWEIAEHFTIPQESKATLSITVEEQQKAYDFETWVAVKGFVNAKFYDKEGKIIHTWEVPMQKFINQEIEENRRRNDNGTQKMLFSGLCEFKYGIEQHTQMKTISIHDKESKLKRA